ncbi:hypothetical protein ACIGNW_00185 [Streptomyces sp. NPDC053707]|uniref:hypothetical protein n=1 Tax=Streptomyces sp. NPDC053707 TaxID=3365712 RepID=UPI0037D16075
MFRTTMLTAATAAIAAGLLLTACSTPDTTSRPAPAAAAPAAAAEPDLAAHTRQVFDITWAGSSTDQQTQLCNGLTLLGRDGAQEEMAKGAGYTTDLDWDLMTDLLEAECDNR